jgi:hypothetical protein
MKVSKKITLLLMSLLSTTFISATQHDQSAKMPQPVNSLNQEAQWEELHESARVVIKMIADFEDKYGYKPRLLCTTCKKDTQSEGSVLGSIFLALIDIDADQKRLYAAKKLLTEAVEIFPYKELDELLEFMARAANELQMPCDGYKCLGRHWEIIHAD